VFTHDDALGTLAGGGPSWGFAVLLAVAATATFVATRAIDRRDLRNA
jgi:hypothetical protein